MRSHVALELLATVLLTACTPALNWRQVDLDGAQFLLPCTPDQAARDVQLAGQRLPMHMQGCSAEGALFAVSHVHLDSVDLADSVVAAWQRSALAALQARDTPQDLHTDSVTRMDASGTDAHGAPMRARWAWWVRGPDVYHLAVYAPVVEAEMSDPFMDVLRSR